MTYEKVATKIREGKQIDVIIMVCSSTDALIEVGGTFLTEL